MGKAEEPEKLGLLAESEILKNEISCEKPLHDMPTPCLLRTVVRDAGQLKRRGEAAEEKEPSGRRC